MSDLISRKAAITLPVKPKEHREYQTFNLDDAYEQGWNDLQKCIELLPTAEPEERKKGKWIEFNTTNHSYVCSVCGRSLINITSGKKTVVKAYPFCHCGAEMTGVEDYQYERFNR